MKNLGKVLRENKKLQRKIAIGLISFFAVFSLYHLAFANRVIPGVKVGGIKVGGKTPSQVEKVLKEKFDSSDIQITFTYENNEFYITDDEIELKYKVKESVERAFYLGRSGNFFVDSKDKLAALIKGVRLAPVYSYSDSKLGQKVSLIEGLTNIQYIEPSFILVDGNLVASKGQDGRFLKSGEALDNIFSSINTISSNFYELSVEEAKSDITEADLLSVKPEVEKIISTPFEINYGYKKWTYSKEDLLSLLSYKKENGETKVVSNKVLVDKIANQIASEVDVEARGEVFRVEGERVVEFKPSEDGRKLDISKFKRDFSNALVTGSEEVELTFVTSPAPENSNGYGIFALLGEGVSHFNGSIPGRIKNLTLAAGRASGVLVPPGELYSFNKTVGEISSKTGYDQAYIIEKGRTVLGEGGGVCQTSTTLFRAALNAGLPIEKRSAHAYRVVYYEIQSEPGLDATVYSPTVDFQFRNDTPNYILIQADWDIASYMLRFRIYGTPDGRTVEMTKPVVTNVIAPPEAVYEVNDSLPEGVVKQIDWAAWGATVSFDRLVKRGNEVLYQDTFVSKYRPWRAVYQKKSLGD